VTELLPVIDTVQPPLPVQLPDQPAKFESLAGVAVSVTEVPGSYWAEHVEPQLIPAGELVTEPLPVPVFVTVSVCWSVNVAVTVVPAFIVTWHVPVPEQPPPDQPANLEPAAAVAVSVTEVPLA
jgi:hypothetical protein